MRSRSQTKSLQQLPETKDFDIQFLNVNVDQISIESKPNKRTKIVYSEKSDPLFVDENDIKEEVNIDCKNVQMKVDIKCESDEEFVCPKCPKSFAIEKCLAEHLINNCDTHICPECSKSFDTETALQEHTVSHTKTTEFQCVVCERYFISKRCLNDHFALLHSTNRPYECSDCGNTFALKKHLTNHRKRHSLALFCKDCNHQYTSVAHFRIHLLNFHRNDRKYVCKICDKKFVDAYGLKRHSKNHEGKPFKCNLCNSSFALQTSLKAHYNIHTKSELFKCFTCDKTYGHARSLREHVLKHSTDTRRCVPCGRSFKDLKSYKRHLAGHKDTLKCKDCKKMFANRSRLTKHKQIVHNRKRQPTFKCGECEKAFSAKHNLKIHMLIHLESKPLCCLHCDKRFRQVSHLKKHLACIHKFNKRDISSQIKWR